MPYGAIADSEEDSVRRRRLARSPVSGSAVPYGEFAGCDGDAMTAIGLLLAMCIVDRADVGLGGPWKAKCLVSGVL